MNLTFLNNVSLMKPLIKLLRCLMAAAPSSPLAVNNPLAVAVVDALIEDAEEGLDDDGVV